MRLTDNQLRILDCLIKGNPDESEIDLDQLLDRLGDEYGWYTSKPSLQFSLRQLIQAGMVERLDRELRRQRMRRLLKCTDLGRAVMGLGPGSPALSK